MLMFSQYLSILVAVASLMYAAGERNKISDVLNTPVESYFNGIGYKCTMLGLTSFAVVLMVITLACFISQNSKKGKNHILDLKEKDQGTLKLDSIPDRREKEVTNVKEMKDNEKDTEEPKQTLHQNLQEQPEVSPCLYDEISEKGAKKKEMKASNKAKKPSKIPKEPSISALSTEDEYVSIKMKESAKLLKSPEAYSNLVKEFVGPGIYEEISIIENSGGKADFVFQDTYTNTSLVRPVSKMS